MKSFPRYGALAAVLGVAVIASNAMLAQSAGRSLQSQAISGRIPQPLVQRAQAQGRVRVIVGLNVATIPEGLLTASQRGLQRALIAQAQAAVLNDLAAFNFGQVKRFNIVAAMGLDASLPALDALATHPQVAYIEEDRLSAPTLAQSTAIIGAQTAWLSGHTGTGVAVAILDTGVDRLHPFFGGRVVSEACYSTTASGSTALCTWGSTATGAAAPCTGIGSCDHGTHVAGIAGGSGASFSGVAPSASIIAVQVFSRFDGGICSPSPSPCVLSYNSDQIAALERVYELRSTYNIAAANMSLGAGVYSSQASCDSDNTTKKAAIDALRSVGIATVISSGNNGSANGLSAPGCISSAVSVGSTIDNGAVDQISSFSNSASFLSLLAPGQVITSSVPGGGFSGRSGTSMAAPHVTGAWALVKSTAPSASVSQVLQVLRGTGTGIFDSRNGVTTPRINVSLALSAFGSTPGPDGGGLPDPGLTGDPDVPSGFGIQESIITVPAFAFLPRDTVTTFAGDVAAGRWVTGGGRVLYAPLPSIPNGADVTQIVFYIDDSDPSADFNGRLCRHWTESGTGLNPGADCPVNITSTGTGSRLIQSDMSPALTYRFDVNGNGVIDNVSYSLSGGWGTSTNGSIKLRHVRLLWRVGVSPAPGFATFGDVPVGSPYHRFVEALASAGIIGGCGAGNYCPNTPVTRGEMAVFISMALGLHWPAL